MKAITMPAATMMNHKIIMAGIDAMAHLTMKRHIEAMLISTSVTTTD
jgi:hypothetical protein